MGLQNLGAERLNVILTELRKRNGELVINYSADDAGSEFMIRCSFGQEAPNSPIFGGEAYGVSSDINEALGQILDQTGWVAHE